jgi:hypothetical protein
MKPGTLIRWLRCRHQKREGRSCQWVGGGSQEGIALTLFRLGRLNTRSAVTLSTSSDFWGVEFVRRRDLLNPDVMSEIILLGFGVLIIRDLVADPCRGLDASPGLV